MIHSGTTLVVDIIDMYTINTILVGNQIKFYGSVNDLSSVEITHWGRSFNLDPILPRLLREMKNVGLYEFTCDNGVIKCSFELLSSGDSILKIGDGLIEIPKIDLKNLLYKFSMIAIGVEYA